MKKSILIFSLILLSLSCSNLDDNLDSTCDQTTIVDINRYKSNLSEGFTIRSVAIAGDCLEVEIEASGCNGDNWKVELIDADRVAESLPPQRDLKILFESRELCNSTVNKTYTFDLKPVRVSNNVVLLNLELWEGLIRYEY